MNTIPKILSTLFLFLVLSGQASATSKGLAAILLDAWDTTSVKTAAAIYKGGKGDLQIAVWGRGDYSKLTLFVKEALPDASFSSLKITVYLVFEPHDFGDGKTPQYSSELWNLSASPTKGIKIGDRAVWFNSFANEIYNWAKGKNLHGKLRFTVAPALEDRAPENQKYQNVLNLVKSKITAPQVSYRRNPLHNSENPVRNVDNMRLSWPMPIELHTAGIPTVTNWNHYGVDVWTNDGYDSTTIGDFTAKSKTALSMGASALYWDSSFNWGPGQTRDTKLADRKPTPFVNNETFKEAVRKFIQQ